MDQVRGGAAGARPPAIEGEIYGQILAIAGRLASTSDLESVLSLIIDALRDLLRADRASVFQYDADAHEFFATRAHGLPGDLRLGADAGIIGEAARTRGLVNIPDAYADERFNQAVDKATGYRTRCLLTIPLVDFDDRLIGVAQVLNKEGGAFDDRDEAIALHLSSQAGVALKRAALIEAEREKDRLASSLQIARLIQQSALPDALPEIAGYEIEATTRPADETGGDAFELIQSGDGSLIVFLADATGHGVGPALSAAHALAMVRMGAALGAPLDRMVTAINAQLCQDLPLGRFITAMFARLDPVAHQFHAIAPGQAPTLIVRDGGRSHEMLPASCAPLGIDPTLTPDPLDVIDLGPGDLVVLLSDGYYEAMNGAGVPIGFAPVCEMVAGLAALSPGEILRSLDEEISRYAGGALADDDQTAIIVKRKNV